MTGFLAGFVVGLPVWGGATLWVVRRFERPPAPPELEPRHCYEFGCTAADHIHPREWA